MKTEGNFWEGLAWGFFLSAILWAIIIEIVKAFL